MNVLPIELTRIVTHDLNAADLSAYCATSAEMAKLCNDSLFWLQKIRSLSRNELQDDWFLQLARLGEERLFLALCRALEKEQWPIDEWAAVLALVWFSDPNNRNRSERVEYYLAQRLFPDESGHTHERMEYYFGPFSDIEDVGYALAQYHNQLADDAQEIRDYVLKPASNKIFRFGAFDSSSHHLQSYERSVKVQIDRRDLLTLDVFLSYALSIADNKRRLRPVLETIDNYLLPTCLEDQEVDAVVVYLQDLLANEDKIMEKLREYTFGLPIAYAPDLRSYLFDAASQYLTYESLEELLAKTGVTWEMAYIDRENYGFKDRYYADLRVYKKITELMEYDGRVVERGFSCMEPEEWLEWIDEHELLIDDRDLVIEGAYLDARRSGYSYFANVLANEFPNLQ